MKDLIEKLKQIEQEEKEPALKTALLLSIYQLEQINAVIEKRENNVIHTES